MPTVTPTTKLEINLGGCVLPAELPCVLGGTWTDLTADTRSGVQPIIATYGIGSGGPNDRVAGAGSLQFALNNADTNSYSTEGAFSPGHANAIDGWDIGQKVRLSLTDPTSGTTYWKFAGLVQSIVPSAGQYSGNKAVQVTATDWLDEAATSRLLDKGIIIETDQRANDLVDTLVTSAVSRQPDQTDYDEGISVFSYAFDNLAGKSCLAALKDTVLSELGFLYIKGSTVSPGGVLRFESRHTRPKIGAVAYTFDNTQSVLTASRARDDLINKIYVTVHPRSIGADSTSVLWELTTTTSVPNIAPGATLYLTAPFTEASINAYRIGGEELTTPVAGTDWIANTASDGSGSVITGDTTYVIDQADANSARLKFVNNGLVTAYLTTVQLRGKTVKDVSATVVSATDSASQTKFGELDRKVDMVFEDDPVLASEAAKWLLHIFATPRYVVQSMSVVGSSSALLTQVLALEPGSKIAITEAMTGLNAVTYFINGVTLRIAPSGLTSADWVLAPAEQQASWILNTSLLGIGTRLGFASLLLWLGLGTGVA